MDKITMNGKYQTRGNAKYPSRPVRILATDMKGGDASIIGLVTTCDGTEWPQCWRTNGSSMELGVYDSPEDLVPVPTEIDICKEYRTRGGAAVDILKTHMKNPDAQIIGIITNEDGSETCESWTEDGRGVSPLRNILADLVPVPERQPVVHQMWAVMKDGSDEIAYSSYSKMDAEIHCNIFARETVRLIQWNT